MLELKFWSLILTHISTKQWWLRAGYMVDLNLTLTLSKLSIWFDWKDENTFFWNLHTKPYKAMDFLFDMFSFWLSFSRQNNFSFLKIINLLIIFSTSNQFCEDLSFLWTNRRWRFRFPVQVDRTRSLCTCHSWRHFDSQVKKWIEHTDLVLDRGQGYFWDV